MDIQQFRALTPDSKLETLYTENLQLRMEISTIHEEISHFRELEDERRKLRKRRAKAAKNVKVGDTTAAHQAGK